MAVTQPLYLMTMRLISFLHAGVALSAAQPPGNLGCHVTYTLIPQCGNLFAQCCVVVFPYCYLRLIQRSDRSCWLIEIQMSLSQSSVNKGRRKGHLRGTFSSPKVLFFDERLNLLAAMLVINDKDIHDDCISAHCPDDTKIEEHTHQGG